MTFANLHHFFLSHQYFSLSCDCIFNALLFSLSGSSFLYLSLPSDHSLIFSFSLFTKSILSKSFEQIVLFLQSLIAYHSLLPHSSCIYISIFSPFPVSYPITQAPSHSSPQQYFSSNIPSHPSASLHPGSTHEASPLHVQSSCRIHLNQEIPSVNIENRNVYYLFGFRH